MADLDDDELLDALGVEAPLLKTSSKTPREERVIAGFEDVLHFYQAHNRTPSHGEGRDIFERIYAMRLDQIRRLPEAQDLLSELDTPGLLSGVVVPPTAENNLDEDALLAALGIADEATDQNDITKLRHVRSSEEKRAAEEIGNRTACKEFKLFKPLFDAVKRELKSGERQTRSFKVRALDEIQQGTFFIIGGQIAYIAAVGDDFTTQYDRRDSRLRVVYDNETESDVLQRSLQRALHRDEAARLITDQSAGPLFSGSWEDDDIESGTIYVLRSLSSHPFVEEHRSLVHKIGVTGGRVESRIASAAHDATYLLAEVEVVATYKLASINRAKLEGLFHRIFAQAQLDLLINDRFGHPVKPREWFLVPLNVIDEAVQHILDGSITDLVYDPKSAQLIHHN